MSIAAAILAAGGGSRFDGPDHKLLASLGGRPVVQWAMLAVAGAGFDEIVVVGGAVDLRSHVEAIGRETGAPLRLVDNAAWAGGQAGSLTAAIGAIEHSDHRAVVVGLGDQPDIGPAAWRTVGATRGAIVTATFGGRRRPPVKLERAIWDLLPTDGDDGARLLMRDRPDLVSEVACTGNPADIDTTEDLAQLAASWGATGSHR